MLVSPRKHFLRNLPLPCAICRLLKAYPIWSLITQKIERVWVNREGELIGLKTRGGQSIPTLLQAKGQTTEQIF